MVDLSNSGTEPSNLNKPMTRRIKTRELISSLVVVVLIIFIVNVGLREVTNNSSPLAVVRGNSMYPLLREGDIIILSKRDPSEIKIGDIIVYKSLKGNLIVHRVINIVSSNGIYYFQTKGDNNYLDDKFLNEYEFGLGISQDRVIGVAIKIGNSVLKIPYLGSIALILS